MSLVWTPTYISDKQLSAARSYALDSGAHLNPQLPVGTQPNKLDLFDRQIDGQKFIGRVDEGVMMIR